jgi:hypothetical protein
MREAIRSSETSVLIRATRRHIRKEGIIQWHSTFFSAHPRSNFCLILSLKVGGVQLKLYTACILHLILNLALIIQ